MSSYIVNVSMRLERETLIAQSINASNDTYTFYEYKNQRSELPVVRLDTGVLVYRLANFRTRTAQIKHIHERELASDFFSSGQENESAQRDQHDILVTFAEKGRASSVTPIMEWLLSEEQRAPLLITSEGVVVNGNRRLAAMRELLTKNPAQFSHFAYVDCAVLPSSVKPSEIREIEVRLQMRPETRLPYGWIEESIAVREMLTQGSPISYVAELMKKKRKEIQTAERALTEVDIYLKEWLNDPESYQQVEDAEQFFNDLAKALLGTEGEMLEAKRRIAWTLLSNADQLPGRIYDYGFSFDRQTDEVIAELIKRLPIEQDEKPGSEASDGSEDTLEIDIGNSVSELSVERLIGKFDDPNQRETIGTQLIDVCVTMNERNRQGKVGTQALVAIRAANTKLMSADLSKADPITYAAIDAQLLAVGEHVTTLQRSLSKYTVSGLSTVDE